jgi:hypothetical protein
MKLQKANPPIGEFSLCASITEWTAFMARPIEIE